MSILVMSKNKEVPNTDQMSEAGAIAELEQELGIDPASLENIDGAESLDSSSAPDAS